VILPRAVRDALVAHARDAAPGECCGVLVGSAGAIVSAVPARNLSGQPSRFLIDPEDHIQARRAARAAGRDVVGFYHSHPDHPARPSQYDLDHAWPTFAYIIVAVASGKSEAMTVWYLKEDRSAFDEGELNGN